MQQAILESVIGSFAKKNKISKAKLAEFEAEVQQIKPERKPAITAVSKGIRETILSKAQGFTSAEIAAETGATTVQVNNNLFALQRQNIVTPTGEKQSTGGRGKPATVWAVAKKH